MGPDKNRHPPRVPHLGLELFDGSAAEFQAWLMGEARERARGVTVGYLNAANVNLAFENPEAARLLRSMDCLYADGQAVVWAARRLGRPVPQRINAGDFIHRFFAGCADEKLKVALIGSASGVARSFTEHYAKRIPELQIVYDHEGYFDADREAEIRRALEEADPHIVLVGMGSPLQERIASQWSCTGRPRVWWCVGALFEYFSGARARAPRWMRRTGLEWLFRLALEPRRLARRYLIGNPKFVYRVLRSSPVPDPPGDADSNAEENSARTSPLGSSSPDRKNS